MSAITTHVLDTARGRPAAGVPITLDIDEGGSWRRLGQGATDGDGRLRDLLPAGQRAAPAVYIFEKLATYGAEERAMLGRIDRVRSLRPDLANQLHWSLIYYCQARYLFETNGLWDPRLGRHEFAPQGSQAQHPE